MVAAMSSSSASRTYSHLYVPLLAAAAGKYHSSIESVKQIIGEELFNQMVNETRPLVLQYEQNWTVLPDGEVYIPDVIQEQIASQALALPAQPENSALHTALAMLYDAELISMDPRPSRRSRTEVLRPPVPRTESSPQERRESHRESFLEYQLRTYNKYYVALVAAAARKNHKNIRILRALDEDRFDHAVNQLKFNGAVRMIEERQWRRVQGHGSVLADEAIATLLRQCEASWYEVYGLQTATRTSVYRVFVCVRLVFNNAVL
jgi:hypothetical protein